MGLICFLASLWCLRSSCDKIDGGVYCTLSAFVDCMHDIAATATVNPVWDLRMAKAYDTPRIKYIACFSCLPLCINSSLGLGKPAVPITLPDWHTRGIAFEQEGALQDWPVTPELHQQDSHTFSDVTPPTEPSPRESPVPPESSQTHYTPSDHPNGPHYQGKPHEQTHPNREHYPQPQNGYAAPVQTLPNGQVPNGQVPNGEGPNGQDYHTLSAPGRFHSSHEIHMGSWPLRRYL